MIGHLLFRWKVKWTVSYLCGMMYCRGHCICLLFVANFNFAIANIQYDDISYVQLLNVDPSPNMNQYVGLLELICSSSPIPTAEVLQDVSVLYARLGKDIHRANLLFSESVSFIYDPSVCSSMSLCSTTVIPFSLDWHFCSPTLEVTYLCIFNSSKVCSSSVWWPGKRSAQTRSWLLLHLEGWVIHTHSCCKHNPPFITLTGVSVRQPGLAMYCKVFATHKHCPPPVSAAHVLTAAEGN